MKMKTVLTALLLSPLVVLPVLGWMSMTAFEKATEYGAKIRIVYVVEDDLGQPVPDAKVHIWLGLENHRDGGKVYYDYTDRDGRYVLDGKTTGLVRYWFVKDGYYESGGELHLESQEDAQNAVKDGMWQPFGECKRITLKRVRNPIAKPFHLGDLAVPANDQWLGLDLEKFMWCSPYGNGQNEDVLLRFTHSSYITNEKVTRVTMEMSFTNNPFAGAYVLKKDDWSDFESVYCANTNADFCKVSFRFERMRTKTKRFKMESFPGDSYIVFRTRTKVDAEGKLKSAHYGKIYGEWQYARYFKHGGILFNSNPNDPNLEDEKSGIRARLKIKGMRERGELK